MKRFYCISCKRIRCNQKWPADINFNPSSNNIPKVIQARHGTCSKHFKVRDRFAEINRQRRVR